jgi:hypothetical protein
MPLATPAAIRVGSPGKSLFSAIKTERIESNVDDTLIRTSVLNPTT